MKEALLPISRLRGVISVPLSSRADGKDTFKVPIGVSTVSAVSVSVVETAVRGVKTSIL